MTSMPGADARTWTIGELNRRANRAVVMDFRGRLWAVGELARIDERRGSRWLELVERGGGREGRDAHLTAFCTATRWQRLQPKLAEAGVELRAGQRLVLAGCLEVGDRGALVLTVEDVDVAALVGDRLRDRRRLVEKLVADGLFDANRRLRLPRLPLRVGVLASRGSDGHRDLIRQLSSSGFAFEVTLRSIPVEGPTAPKAIQAALSSLGAGEVDVAVLVRGGGAKASLDVFDRPPVAHAVATALVPVWTGIGHTGDRSVADEVAHRSFPTPTALGQALVAEVAGAWAELVRSFDGVTRLVDARLRASTDALDGRRREVSTLARSQLARHQHAQAATAADLRRCARRGLDIRAGELAMAAHAVRASGAAEVREARRQLANLTVDATQAARRTTLDAAADLAETAGRLGRDARRALDDSAGRLTARRAVLEAYDPRRQLARGWTLTHTAGGRLIRHATDVSPGDTIVTTFADGSATSTVAEVDSRD